MNSDEKLVVRTRKSLGRIIQENRQRKGWTQEELAWRAEITREHVGRIERDKCVPSVATIKKLEQAFHLPEMALAKWAIVPSDQIDGDSKEESGVDLICQEFGRALAANLHRADLNESELFRVGEAIGTFMESGFPMRNPCVQSDFSEERAIIKGNRILAAENRWGNFYSRMVGELEYDGLVDDQIEKAIFLDIDGVLNDSENGPKIDETMVERLAHIVNNTGAALILSSCRYCSA